MHITQIKCASFSVLTLFGLVLLLVCSNASAESISAAANSHDISALETYSKSTTESTRLLANGILLALHRQDANAIATLNAAIHSTSNHVMRATAYIALAEVYLRDQRYRACYSAARSAIVLSRKSVGLSERQDAAACKALANVKPMRVTHDTAGILPITRDMYGLSQVPVKIGKRRHEAIVDTGAGFSTISASAAKNAGVRMFNTALTVGTASKKKVKMRLGIAPQVQIGSAIVSNVVFIVLPDSDLRFSHRYQMSVIIGLPVLMALGRLEFINSGAPRLLYDAPSGKFDRPTVSHSTLLLSGLMPIVSVGALGTTKPLHMLLDTGSPSARFSYNAVKDVPILFTHAKRHVVPAVGAGGTVKERHAMMLPTVTLVIGGRRVKINNVPVESPAGAINSYGVDGLIGQNVLRECPWWTLDFKAMTFSCAK